MAARRSIVQIGAGEDGAEQIRRLFRPGCSLQLQFECVNEDKAGGCDKCNAQLAG